MTRIRGHKPILQCRSSFFRKEFAENRTEIRLEERLSIVKIALEFIYTGWTDADISPIAFELLTIAAKLRLAGLEELCSCCLRDSLSVSNVVDVVILAHAHRNTYFCEWYHELYRACVPVIKANSHCFSAHDLDKLQQQPVLLRQLLLDCCMNHHEPFSF